MARVGAGRADVGRRRGKRSPVSAYRPRVPRTDVREVRGGSGLEPLGLAARDEDEETVRALLDSGADVNGRSPGGLTALMLAAGAGGHHAAERCGRTGLMWPCGTSRTAARWTSRRRAPSGTRTRPGIW
ncbi:ankyrin repeat domain-containing protein [Streptomyces europaeiscabiei]|uniref:ankyrin repeat domain-containing protein n=1 Tax=Streptomyces europaeiscabiei TaxID=146819 RepID=UPI0038D46924